MKLILRELGPTDEKAFIDGFKEWVGESPHWYTFSWKEGMSFSELLTILEKESKAIDLAPGRVQHSMLYGFVDGEIIGRVSVRHTLNAHLYRRSGHVGYAVAPRFRRKGFAAEMTKQALDFCRKIGLQTILLTCSDTNEPSWKVIESLGGKLEGRVWDDEDKEMIRRYWIDL